MRTTVVLDEVLLERAAHYTGLSDRNAIVREAMKALVERENARRVAWTGGVAPRLKLAPRRRSSWV